MITTMEDDDFPSVLAVPVTWIFCPEECETDYLIGFIEERYDSMNDGDDALVAKEREMAREELTKRGINLPIR